MVVILTVRKHVQGGPKHHIKTNQMVYVANQYVSCCKSMSPAKTESSL